MCGREEIGTNSFTGRLASKVRIPRRESTVQACVKALRKDHRGGQDVALLL